MKSLKEIKRRISAVRGTQKVTRAMKLVASAKLKRAQQDLKDAKPYSNEMHATIKRISRRLGAGAPLLWRRPEEIKCIDLVVVTSDRGLCGGFNENLFKLVDREVEIVSRRDIKINFFVIGKKGARRFKLRGREFESPPQEILTDKNAVVSWLSSRLAARLLSGESSGANIAFNRFISAGKQKPVFWNLLPLHHRGSFAERNLDYIFEPAKEDTLGLLSFEAISSSIRRTFADSYAAEIAARMTAMDNATTNAEDMIAHLTSVYNKARQESITSELMDIVGGAEGLKSK